MNTIVYGITEEIYRTGDSCRISYGIAAYADPDQSGTALIVASVRDISPEREKVAQLADTCNRMAISLCHLPDVVEDFLAM